MPPGYAAAGRITCVEAVHREVVDLTATMPELASLFADTHYWVCPPAG
jgi:hypothetical protein